MNQMTRITAAPVADFKARFTTEEYLRMIELDAFGDMNVELIDGELERMQQPKNGHAMRQARFVIRLAAIAGEARVRGEAGIDLGGDTLVGCDGALLRVAVDENRLLTSDDLLLVVEISETTINRDLGPKRIKYASAGIPEYWVVDAVHSAVHIFRAPHGGEYGEIDLVRFGQPLPVPGTDATITLD